MALWVGYLPWWPVLLDAGRRAPVVPVEPLTRLRFGQVLSFFAFAPVDGEPFRRGTALLWLLVAIGAAIALTRPRQRSLVAWCAIGFAAIEILARLHPHWYGTRRFLPAGIVATALAGVAIGELLRRPVTRLAGSLRTRRRRWCSTAATCVRYFRDGRADWRTLADYLRTNAAPSERVFTENQYSQLCVAFYLVGPSWLEDVETKRPVSRDLPNLEGERVRLTWAWKPGTRAWLVLAGEPNTPSCAAGRMPFPGHRIPDGRERGPPSPRPRASRRLARTNIRRSWTVSCPTRSTT